jgi:light-regulated signal transduction histidine kinase (bacteriophytochrome)
LLFELELILIIVHGDINELDYAKIQKNQSSFEMIKTEEVIQSIIEILNAKEKTKISFSGGFTDLFIDKAAFIQIVQNIISNAIKYNNNPSPTLEIISKKLMVAFLSALKIMVQVFPKNTLNVFSFPSKLYTTSTNTKAQVLV